MAPSFYVGHSMLSCMVSQNAGFLNFSLINTLKMVMGFAYMYVHAHVYAFVPAEARKGSCFPLGSALQIVAVPPRMWVLGMEPSFFARTFNIFNY